MESINYLAVGEEFHCLKCHKNFPTKDDGMIKHWKVCTIETTSCGKLQNKECDYWNKNMNKNKLLGDRVIIAPESVEEKTVSGIIIKKDVEMGDAMTGVVKEVGSGRQTDHGHIVKPSVEVGDKVLFQYGKPITIDGNRYLLVIDSDIIRII